MINKRCNSYSPRVNVIITSIAYQLIVYMTVKYILADEVYLSTNGGISKKNPLKCNGYKLPIS